MGDKHYFFFNHDFPESVLQNLSSKKNEKEAIMIVKFTQYLLKQNYKPEQITILSLYTGQLLVIKQMTRAREIGEKDPVRQVRVSTVDNYQGEENDVVIISLVRSNNDDQIGFLNNSNRICVALSRAKLGLYIFGNARCLKNASQNISNKMKKSQ